ncbi:MAG: BMP family ABC transporter substrate-binding protein [Burkholderiaceae bacterium]
MTPMAAIGRAGPFAITRRRATALLGAVLLPGLPRAGAAAPLKVGFVYVSPLSDAGWTHQHEQGRLALQARLGDRVVTQAVENVREGPDAERVVRDLAGQGHDLIFGTSFGYMEPMLRVARQYPALRFEHASGYKRLPNLATYNARFHEGRYLAGMLAGATTRSNRLGYVAALPIPEVIQGINAFALGARLVNPAAEVRVIWTQRWFDPPRERDAANTLIDQRVDVLTHHTDSSTVALAAEQAGAWALPYHSDMRHIAPIRQLAAVTHHWGEYYIARTLALLQGDWRSTDTMGGLADGMVRIGGIAESVPAVIRERIDASRQAIASGVLNPFAGPITDNAGQVRVTRGQSIRPQDLHTMDWFVQGVRGKPPTK